MRGTGQALRPVADQQITRLAAQFLVAKRDLPRQFPTRTFRAERRAFRPRSRRYTARAAVAPNRSSAPTFPPKSCPPPRCALAAARAMIANSSVCIFVSTDLAGQTREQSWPFSAHQPGIRPGPKKPLSLMPESTSCVTIVHIEATAYHEAGRVFMAIYLGACVRSVTIDGFVAE